ncbi:hypothetical protein NF867_04260 [Solitalea sp. MAHUQ-68]|uniref:Transglycosylase SLT domain-containing protein n=1 Tax=Solitalea agri TaxID=2953739 RepID=A0A9X2JC25_9SPHI|nr:hypothetical protein [Solitalea agri]MCO4292074.1 hypothetical protein [Solitalea agri]
MQKLFKIFVLLACLGLALNGKAQQATNYSEEFGADYSQAKDFLSKNSWIADSLGSYNVPAAFAEAIIFPELVRFSVLRDQMETGGLKILYVSFGKDYADFSIGRFQMKPSFAEQLLTDIEMYKLNKTFRSLLINKTFDEETQRRAVIKSLESPQKQVMYLAAFYQVCEQKFKSKKWTSTEEKLRFYATAYNCGYRQTEKYILQKARQSFFSTSIMGFGKTYNYANISLFYYEQSIEKLTRQ